MPKTIEYIAIKELTLLERNPRTITKDQMEKLRTSLQEDPSFFDARPCLVNRVGKVLTVYAGNQRVRAAKKLGWKEVPCIIDDELDELLMKARIIKDNKTYGQFDFDMLANEWDMEQLLIAGFTEEELTNDIIQVISESEHTEECNKCELCGQKIKNKNGKTSKTN
jgi:ParB-like chromosome segregation protein Spo0J